MKKNYKYSFNNSDFLRDKSLFIAQNIQLLVIIYKALIQNLVKQKRGGDS